MLCQDQFPHVDIAPDSRSSGHNPEVTGGELKTPEENFLD